VRRGPFFRQAQLVIRVLPHVAAEACFAVKGGTAINLFWRDLPRLSVDIDLSYLPVEPRGPSLERIDAALERIGARIVEAIPEARLEAVRRRGASELVRLLVTTADARVAIEPNRVIRGSVFSPRQRDLVPAAEELFEMSVSVVTLSSADLYAGKICAALDRQHPRDLFDIKLLLEGEGITEATRRAFVVYLASHNRPMSELLRPRWKDLRRAFDNELLGMARYPVTHDELVAVRERLIEDLHAALTAREREFLLSLKAGEPDWTLIDVPGADALPGIRWKLANIRRMAPGKRAEALARLRAVLER